MFEDFRSWYRAATTDGPQGKACMFAIRRHEVGLYCARSLGDDPEQSRTGCRFYVYVGRSCEAWRDYHDLDTAVAENPGEPVFDRATVTDILLDQMKHLSRNSSANDSLHHLKVELFRMLRDLGAGDEMVLWSAAQASWSARQQEQVEAGHDPTGDRRSRLQARSEAGVSLRWSDDQERSRRLA